MWLNIRRSSCIASDRHRGTHLVLGRDDERNHRRTISVRARQGPKSQALSFGICTSNSPCNRTRNIRSDHPLQVVTSDTLVGTQDECALDEGYNKSRSSGSNLQNRQHRERWNGFKMGTHPRAASRFLISFLIFPVKRRRLA
jgi:hypothetical protein